MTAVLDVAIGLVFMYLLLALVATTLQELLATFGEWRAKHLYQNLREMLGDERVGLLYDHPLIRNLCQRAGTGRPRPSYIPSKAFALALLDVLERTRPLSSVTGVANVVATADELVQKIELDRVERTLELFTKRVQVEVHEVDAATARLTEQIEIWFDQRMARASGWYKRHAQVWALAIAGALCVAANADSIYAGRRLWDDAALRESVVASAQAYRDAHASLPAAVAAGEDPVAAARALSNRLVAQTKELRSAGFPVGWQRSDLQTAWDYALMVLGLAMTAFAVSLGSGFWFDVLSRVLQLRGTGVRISSSEGDE
jgi:hypothetical protein